MVPHYHKVMLERIHSKFVKKITANFLLLGWSTIGFITLYRFLSLFTRNYLCYSRDTTGILVGISIDSLLLE